MDMLWHIDVVTKLALSGMVLGQRASFSTKGQADTYMESLRADLVRMGLRDCTKVSMSHAGEVWQISI